MRRLAMQNEAILRFMHLRGIQYILGALHAHLWALHSTHVLLHPKTQLSNSHTRILTQFLYDFKVWQLYNLWVWQFASWRVEWGRPGRPVLLRWVVARCQPLPPLSFPNNRQPTTTNDIQTLDARPLFFAIASNLVRCVLRVAASLFRTNEAC